MAKLLKDVVQDRIETELTGVEAIFNRLAELDPDYSLDNLKLYGEAGDINAIYSILLSCFKPRLNDYEETLRSKVDPKNEALNYISGVLCRFLSLAIGESNKYTSDDSYDIDGLVDGLKGYDLLMYIGSVTSTYFKHPHDSVVLDSITDTRLSNYCTYSATDSPVQYTGDPVLDFASLARYAVFNHYEAGLDPSDRNSHKLSSICRDVVAYFNYLLHKKYKKSNPSLLVGLFLDAIRFFNKILKKNNVNSQYDRLYVYIISRLIDQLAFDVSRHLDFSDSSLLSITDTLFTDNTAMEKVMKSRRMTNKDFNEKVESVILYNILYAFYRSNNLPDDYKKVIAGFRPTGKLEFITREFKRELGL